MTLSMNEEYMVNAANYIEEVLNGDGGTNADKDTINDSLKETYQQSEIIGTDRGWGHGAGNSGNVHDPSFSFPGTHVEVPTGTSRAHDEKFPRTKDVEVAEPKDFKYSGNDAPWASVLKQRVTSAMENRRSDVLHVIEELEAYHEILLRVLKEFLKEDFDNAGLIDKSPDEDARDPEGDVEDQKQDRNR